MKTLCFTQTELEFSILASMLASEKSFYTCIAILRPEDFLNEDCKKLFSYLKKRYENGENYEEICAFLDKDYEKIAMKVLDFPLPEEHVLPAIRRLIESSKRRKELEVAKLLASEKIDRTQVLSMLAEIERDRSQKGGHIKVCTQNYLEKVKNFYDTATVPGITTGSFELDRIFTLRNELTLICARPSIGKTITALKLLYNQAVSGIAVQFFSLELTEDEVVARLCAIHLKRSLKDIVYCHIGLEEINSALEYLSKLPIYIEPGPLTLPQIKAKIFEVKPEVVYIDYVQKVQPHTKFPSRKDFLDYVSHELLEISKRVCPVVALAQLNRQVRTGKDEPTIDHIKETGNFEQDASNIILLHRNLLSDPNTLKMRVAKCRVNKAGYEITVNFTNGIPDLKLKEDEGNEKVSEYAFDF